MVPKRQARGWGSELPEQGWECSSRVDSDLKMETRLPRQQSRPTSGPSAKDPAGRDSPGHLRPSADLEAQASTWPAAGRFQAEGVSGASRHALHVGGRGAGARLLWPRPRLAFLALYAPPPCPSSPCSSGKCGVWAPMANATRHKAQRSRHC